MASALRDWSKYSASTLERIHRERESLSFVSIVAFAVVTVLQDMRYVAVVYRKNVLVLARYVFMFESGCCSFSVCLGQRRFDISFSFLNIFSLSPDLQKRNCSGVYISSLECEAVVGMDW